MMMPLRGNDTRIAAPLWEDFTGYRYGDSLLCGVDGMNNDGNVASVISSNLYCGKCVKNPHKWNVYKD